MSETKIGIRESVLENVSAALNVALSLALVHAPEMHPQIMAAAMVLDDAVNEAME